jgi:hypothetical protein
MLKFDEYRDLGFWDFLVVTDLVLFVGLDLREAEGFEAVGLRTESKDGWIVVRGEASVMIGDG